MKNVQFTFSKNIRFSFFFSFTLRYFSKISYSYFFFLFFILNLLSLISIQPRSPVCLFGCSEIALQVEIEPEPMKTRPQDQQHSQLLLLLLSFREIQTLKSRKDHFFICFSGEPNINFQKKEEIRDKTRKWNAYVECGQYILFIPSSTASARVLHFHSQFPFLQ